MKNELFDMYSWLRGYLYIILLMIISSSSFALEVTPKEIAMGGFAFPVICSHPTNLSYCVKAERGPEAACNLMGVTITSNYSTYNYSFVGVSTLSNGVNRCEWEGRNPSNNSKTYESAQLYNKSGLCPVQGSPPPEQVVFSRNGRWFPQELHNKRCYRSCMYSNAQSFNYKHYAFTNGVMTNFTENMSNRLESTQEFCDAVPEPSRNSQGEITYDAGCEDNMFKVFCDFVEWFRSDSEMPEAPSVENEQLNLGYIKADWVSTNLPANTTCFDPVEFNFFLPWSRTEVKQEVRFEAFCNGVDSFGNFLRALYLLHAALIIFRR